MKWIIIQNEQHSFSTLLINCFQCLVHSGYISSHIFTLLKQLLYEYLKHFAVLIHQIFQQPLFMALKFFKTFYRWRNWGTEKFNHLPKVTEVWAGRAQADWLWEEHTVNQPITSLFSTRQTNRGDLITKTVWELSSKTWLWTWYECNQVRDNQSIKTQVSMLIRIWAGQGVKAPALESITISSCVPLDKVHSSANPGEQKEQLLLHKDALE